VVIIRPFSDLHVDFSPFTIPPMPRDHDTVLVLAGDVCDGRRALDYVLMQADRFKSVVWVFGNHEFYGESFTRLVGKVRSMIPADSNISVLDNASMTVDDIEIIGSTLWSDFDKGGSFSMWGARRGMNDFTSIRNGPPGVPYMRRFSPKDALERHLESRGFLADAIGTSKNAGRTPIVVTHHAPAPNHEHPDYRGSGVSGAYVSDMVDFVSRHRPAAWISGHTHYAMVESIGSTLMVSNPRGYMPKYGVDEFDPWLTVQIEGGKATAVPGRPQPTVIEGRRIVLEADVPEFMREDMRAALIRCQRINDGWDYREVATWIRSIIGGSQNGRRPTRRKP
jgi:predicted phosphodiesterase